VYLAGSLRNQRGFSRGLVKLWNMVVVGNVGDEVWIEKVFYG